MKYHIITYGCQMNKSDSERIASFFDKKGFQESSLNDADIIIVNSCSIRQSAVDRMEAKIRKIKKTSHQKIILTGCMLEKDKKKLAPFFDYYFPPQNTKEWTFLKKEKNENFFDITPKRSGITAYISIMTGCDNFCSYCVVPYAKGREKSRDAKEIIKETKEAIEKGYKEIWLLGQNVNSYKGGMTFAELLREINKMKGNFWIRFTSSHPKDLSSDIVSAMKDCKKMTKYLHLPIQSGDDDILKKMNRLYNIKEYKGIIEEVRKSIPGISISTDVIVGFPGETEKNFSNTVKLFREMEFDMAYIARYSPREQTVAYNLKETVKNEEKRRREKILEEIIKENASRKNRRFLKKTLTVLVLRKSKNNKLIGKTTGYQNIIFEGEEVLVGSFVKIKVTHSSIWGLKGKINRK
jgi:tRNA-2-methylthio-N6-dimethylallyladenosine synthase